MSSTALAIEIAEDETTTLNVHTLYRSAPSRTEGRRISDTMRRMSDGLVLDLVRTNRWRAVLQFGVEGARKIGDALNNINREQVEDDIAAFCGEEGHAAAPGERGGSDMGAWACHIIGRVILDGLDVEECFSHQDEEGNPLPPAMRGTAFLEARDWLLNLQLDNDQGDYAQRWELICACAGLDPWDTLEMIEECFELVPMPDFEEPVPPQIDFGF